MCLQEECIPMEAKHLSKPLCGFLPCHNITFHLNNCFTKIVKSPLTSSESLQWFIHRIINERIEKSIKGRRIGHTGEIGRGLLCISSKVVMLARLVLPWRTLRPPPFPTPADGCAYKYRLSHILVYIAYRDTV